jgi:hypothetical protein
MKVTGANDLPIPYLGYIELDISIVKTMNPKVGFLVVKDTEDNSKSKLPFLLGKCCNCLVFDHNFCLWTLTSNVSKNVILKCIRIYSYCYIFY